LKDLFVILKRKKVYEGGIGTGKTGYKICALWLSFFVLFSFAKEITSVKSVQDLQDVVHATILKTSGYTFAPSTQVYTEITATLEKFKDDAWVKRRRKDIETFMREHPQLQSSHGIVSKEEIIQRVKQELRELGLLKGIGEWTRESTVLGLTEDSLWCAICDNAPRKTRIEFIGQLVEDIQRAYSNKQEELSYISLASGNFLQDYLTLKILIDCGYVAMRVHLIDIGYTSSMPWGLALLSKRLEDYARSKKSTITISTYNDSDNYLFRTKSRISHNTVIVMVDTSKASFPILSNQQVLKVGRFNEMSVIRGSSEVLKLIMPSQIAKPFQNGIVFVVSGQGILQEISPIIEDVMRRALSSVEFLGLSMGFWRYSAFDRKFVLGFDVTGTRRINQNPKDTLGI
jgi:hypothetical protein